MHESLRDQVADAIAATRDPGDAADRICALLAATLATALDTLTHEQRALHRQRATAGLIDQAREHAIRSRAHRRSALLARDLLTGTAPIPRPPRLADPALRAAATALALRRWIRSGGTAPAPTD